MTPRTSHPRDVVEPEIEAELEDYRSPGWASI